MTLEASQLDSRDFLARSRTNRPLLIGLLAAAMLGAIPAFVETVQSPLTLLAGPGAESTDLSTEAILAELTRLARSHRALQAAEETGRSAPSGKREALLSRSQYLLNRLLTRAPEMTSISEADGIELASDWNRLLTSQDRISDDEPARRFDRHTQLIDRQLALWSGIQTPSRK
ncbi:MAG: hypothetical protein KDF54_01430 [Hydrogenophaga sp.]|nr:hypothetical protein [Hydrogenophaga sp.]